MKYSQFAVVTGPNADLAVNKNMRNIGYYNSKLWFGIRDDVNMSINSAPSITGATTEADTQAISDTASGGSPNIIVRVFGDDIYCCVVSYDAASQLILNYIYSTDGGSNWTKGTNSHIIDIVANGSAVRIVDIFKSGSDWFALCSFQLEGVEEYCNYCICKNATTWYDHTPNWIKEIESIYAGRVNATTGDYEFYVVDDADDFLKVIFDVSAGTFSDSVVTGLTIPAVFDINCQQFWVQGTQELMIDQDHFMYRTVGSSTWQSVSDSGSTTNGIVWYYRDGLYIINWIIWRDSIYKIAPGGAIMKIQTYTGDAYVGWDDWFAEGTDAIWQLTTSLFLAQAGIVTSEVEKAPLCVTTTATVPGNESYLFYDPDDTLIFQGTVQSKVSNGGIWTTTYSSGIADDLNTVVTIAAVNATPHAWIKSIIDTYCQYMWYDAGIDDAFAALDFPAVNGKTVRYCFRLVSLLKQHWFYYKPTLEVYWDDGTVDSGKDVEFGTEPILKPSSSSIPPVTRIIINGKYSAGDRVVSTDEEIGTTITLEEWIPEADATLGALLATSMLAMYNVTQLVHSVGTWDQGFYQQGQQTDYASGDPLGFTTAKRFILKSVYNGVTEIAQLTLGEYLQLPKRGQLQPEQLIQYVDNVEKNIHWTPRDPTVWDYAKTDLTDDTNWNDIDLSAIVGAKKMLVLIRIYGQDGAINSRCFMRTNGVTNGAHALEGMRIQTANSINELSWLIETDSSGIVEFACNPKPTDWDSLQFVIKAYKEA